MRRTMMAIAGIGMVGGVAIAATAMGGGSASATTTTPITVPATVAWTNTGISVTSGQLLTITATGSACWGGGHCTGPYGKAFAKSIGGSTTCGQGQYAAASSANPFVAPGLSCDALIARIGSTGIPFYIGAQYTVNAPATGALYLGMNDNFFADNSGSWSASVTS